MKCIAKLIWNIQCLEGVLCTWQKFPSFCVAFFKLCRQYTTGFWHIVWVCGFSGFVILATYGKAEQSHQCQPLRRKFWSSPHCHMRFSWTNNPEDAATVENQNFSLLTTSDHSRLWGAALWRTMVCLPCPHRWFLATRWGGLWCILTFICPDGD